MIKTDDSPLTSINMNSKPSVRLGRWLGDRAEYQFKIEHKKGTDNILADVLSRLNLPSCDEDEMSYAEKIINSAGSQYD